MKKMKLVLVLILMWPLGASADLSGNDLLALCAGTAKGEPDADEAKYNDCLNFLSDASDPPSWAGDEKLRQVYLAYTKKYPEELSWDAGTVVINSYDDAFPKRN